MIHCSCRRSSRRLTYEQALAAGWVRTGNPKKWRCPACRERIAQERTSGLTPEQKREREKARERMRRFRASGSGAGIGEERVREMLARVRTGASVEAILE